MSKIYIASSWRNTYQPEVVSILRSVGHEVYDFKHPEEGNDGFHWSSIDRLYMNWDSRGLREGLRHPIAQDGFAFDFNAMKWADQCVLVLPCGRSAHLEAGWFAGQRKPLTILSLELLTIEPELMYLLAGSPDDIVTNIQELVERIYLHENK